MGRVRGPAEPVYVEGMDAGAMLAIGASEVTPDDDNDLGGVPTKALWVGGAGKMTVVMSNGSEATFEGIQAGTLLPLSVRRVKVTDTDATLIVALY